MAKSYYQKYKQPRVHVQVWTEANGPVPRVSWWTISTETFMITGLRTSG